MELTNLYFILLLKFLFIDFKFTKNLCPTNANIANETCSLWSPIRNNDITWNFEKFLINHHGHLVYRIQPAVEPLQITYLIQNLIDAYFISNSIILYRCKYNSDKNNLFGTIDINNTRYEKYQNQNNFN